MSHRGGTNRGRAGDRFEVLARRRSSWSALRPLGVVPGTASGLWSGGRCAHLLGWSWEGQFLVIPLFLLEAGVELSDHAVEEVALGGVPICVVVAASPVVGFGTGGSGDRGERSEVAGGIEAVVLDPASGDAGFLAGGPGDGRGAGVCLQAAGVGEPCPVVADLGEHPGAELCAETGEAEDDLSVRVLRERLVDRLGEVVGGRAGGSS